MTGFARRGAAGRLLFSIILALSLAPHASAQTTAPAEGTQAGAPQPSAEPERARGPAIPADARVTTEAPDEAQPGANAPETPAPEASDATAAPAPASPAAAAAPASPEAAAAPAAPAGEAGALISVLRDPVARERLITELEKLAAGGAAAPLEAGQDAAAAEAPLGTRIADFTRETAAHSAARFQAFVSGLRATGRRLAGLADADLTVFAAALRALAVVVAVTVAARLALGLVLTPARRRIGRAAESYGPLRKAGAVSGAALLDMLGVLLAAAGGHALALVLLEPAGEIEFHQALFLNAFVLVGLGCAAVRTVLAPKVPTLRLTPMSDATAAHWLRWGAVLIGILGYGLMLAVPVVREAVNLFTARAVSVVVTGVVLFAAMALAIRHRKAPRAHFEARAAAAGGDVTIELIAYLSRFWHIGVVVFLLAIFSATVRQSGNIAPILSATGKIIGAALLGAFVMAVLGRASTHGVILPGAVTERLPLLERRINTFVPGFLKLVRFVVMLAVVAYALHVMGLADIEGWLAGALGVDLAGTLVAVGLIVMGGFAVWLGLASWIDYRLTPSRGRRITSREQTLLSLLRNAATIAIAVITGMFALSRIGVDIAPLIASAGVVGLAIGFGAQRMVQDIITGIFIQFENAINVGDVVTLGSTTGTVEKLTIRSVSLRDVQGVFHIIPFSSVDAVSNYMRGFAYHVADIGIAYREDIDEAKALMFEAFETLRADSELGSKILGELEWFGVQALGDSAVMLRARIKTRPGDQWGVGRAYNEAVKKRFDAAGVEIPFPHMTIWFGEGKDGSAPPAPVALAESRIARALVEGRAAPAEGAKPRPRGKAKAPTQDTPLPDDEPQGEEDGR
ncbi:mechanosensitive ion channel [Limibaculum sp. FT325]|uniref:mechanosensitive ion channel domain-containing protein n=1 Tax=Thermohalobaculum sediminis TaxID=2939436 RepID=UPI0020BEFECB|nr:mechanosensitive ion channel domain-containing protein [Limibaculum sediminis]MCL5777812.1 mechanosensitive ion channel [Limibaculum sediminis]